MSIQSGEEEQWEDLWNDIVELRGRPDDRHYMGALVVEGESDREFLIIDGQQRLATLSILALAAIKQLDGMADAGRESAATRTIPEVAPEEWTLPLLDERQRRLAVRAVHVWRADFA